MPIKKIHNSKLNIFLFDPHESEAQMLEWNSMYRTRAIIARSRSETALKYKPRILGLKNEEYPFLVHKLSVI